jgi:uncharacterized SAM-binding protein YcdF (DUF218 family)
MALEFWFKKIVGPLFFPMSLSLELLAVALVLLLFTRRQRLGKVLVAAAFVLLLAFSHPPLSERLVRPLEATYPPASLDTGAPPNPPRHIVVLGASLLGDRDLPPNSRISEITVARFVEAVRLHRQFPDSQIVVSVPGKDTADEKRAYLDALSHVLAVDPHKVRLLEGARDTDDEATLIRPLVGDDPFYLVTSASHMRRATALFRRLGMAPTPAPSAYLVRHRQTPRTLGLTHASAEGIRCAETAFYEYLGLLWSSLRRQI